MPGLQQLKRPNRNKKWTWKDYFLPGFIFQSVVIGGGYGTGIEIARYFGIHGLAGGILGLMITMSVWSLLCAVTFEFVRIFQTFDYHSMMCALLGRAGWLYEICYLILLLIVLGLINATAGQMFQDLLGLPSWTGKICLSAGIILLVVKGTEAVEKALSFWSCLLYIVFFLLLFIVFQRFGGRILWELSRFDVQPGWSVDGFKYAFYNLGIIPTMLYALHNIKNRREALICGVLSGVSGVVPAVLLLLAMGCNLPAVLSSNMIPVNLIFAEIQKPWLYLLFELVLFGTLIETGAGFVKALDDRVETTMQKKCDHVFPGTRSTIAIGAALLGILISDFGLKDLVDKGYGTICWGFLLVYGLPMLTIGVWKIKKTKKFRTELSSINFVYINKHRKDLLRKSSKSKRSDKSREQKKGLRI